jgi:threonine/homoserine/homoserine lactone efflux protein
MAYTPGPINIMSMNNAKNIGLRKGIIFNFGNYAGHFIVMLVCLAFSKALYTILPKIQLPMKILGATYLVYLVVKTIVPAKKHEVKDNQNRSFIVGALLQLINVKVILFGITVMSSYLLPYYTSVLVLLAFAFLMSSVQLTGNVCWTLFGSLFNIFFNKYSKILNIIMAILLLYCAVSLFL